MLKFGAMSLAILVALRVCDHYLESDREHIERKLKLMGAGVTERNLDKVFEHVSETFHYNRTRKADLRAVADRALQSQQVTSLQIKSIQEIKAEGDKATALFRFNLKGASVDMLFLCKATFVRESGNEWRLETFEVYPATGMSDPYTVPGL